MKQMLENKRVLVTGGAGFLDSFLCERLLVAGCEVLCVDNYFSERRRTRSETFRKRADRFPFFLPMSRSECAGRSAI